MKGRVAILGMGCSVAGGRFARNQEELMVEAGLEALADAALDARAIQAVWASALGANQLTNFALKLDYTGQTGASGPDILRCAYAAIASGAYDVVLAAAVEKLTDFGLTDIGEGATRGAGVDRPGAFGVEDLLAESRPAAAAALYLTRYQSVFDVPPQKLRDALSHIVARSRRAGARHPRADLRTTIAESDVARAPLSAGPLTVLDSAGLTDGAAAAVVCSAEFARRSGRPFVVVEGFGMATASSGARRASGYDFTGLPETRDAARRAYEMAGITHPPDEIDHIELFDSTSAAELFACEDLGLVGRGQAVDRVLAGDFDPEGRIPANTDGGLLCNGNQPGATAIRQLYESYLQLTGRAGERQLPRVRRSLVHTVAGTLDSHSVFVQVLGLPA
jgi:acetyl-CoA C-acetyltransferase